MRKTFVWISTLEKLGRAFIDNLLSECDIHNNHHPYIFHACDTPGITQDRLHKILYVHPSNVSRALESLERKGYIRREIHEKDKRKSRIYPTEKAFKMFHVLRSLENKWLDIITSGFSDSEKEMLEDLLLKGVTSALNREDL